MADYKVVKGDTFWKIAENLLGDGNKWKDLFVNGKPASDFDPKSIQPGWTITTSGSSSGGSDDSSGGTSATTEALPQNAELVKVGNTYRVVWSLGDGLGYAWYNITGDQLTDLYKTKTPDYGDSVANVGAFESKYGNNFWGNVGEINLKADTPWEDLRDRIYSQFGWVPGFDDPQIKRMMTQAYFEDWDQNQWLVEYRKTDYYQNSTDAQRQWVGLSEAEKKQRAGDVGIEMTNFYRDYMGKDIDKFADTITSQALKIASGQMTMDHWLYALRQQAAGIEGTPIWQQDRQAEEDALAEGNQIENLTLFAEQQWRDWVGPISVPDNFATTWGNNLASGKASEADLENYLKEISNSRWTFKPPNLTWQDWSSTYKQQVKSTLELGTLDDEDPLLNQILSSDLNGVDLNTMIRQDQRFRSTQAMYGELSGAAEEMGRKFGFIA